MESFEVVGPWASVCLGRRYVRNHTGNQRNPSPPITAKHVCQPNLKAMNMTRGGPKILARFVPAFTTPMAEPRSSEGNHSAVALTHAGKLADSPNPSTVRNNPN